MTPRALPPSGDDDTTNGHYLLHWQARGHAWVLQNGRRARLEPGGAVLIDARRPYQISYISARHDELVLPIPCKKLDAMIRDAESLTIRVLHAEEPAIHLLGLLMTVIQRERTRRAIREEVRELSLSEAVVSVVAAALRELPGPGRSREPSVDETYRLASLGRYLKSLLPQVDLSAGFGRQAAMATAAVLP